VDPANPGQFLACCGVLELAARLWPGAEGWFASEWFCVACGGDLRTLLSVLLKDPPEEVTLLPGNLPVKPLIAPLRFSFDGGATKPLTLAAWMTVRVEKGEVVAAANPPWNFWSGQQTPMRIWSALRAALARQLARLPDDGLPDLFGRRVPLTGRFGFDPGAAWNALDVGFSPNEQGMEVASSAAVELLAAVGVERFRPAVAGDRESFVYSTWGRPLAPPVAAAASAGLVRVDPATRYRGRIVSRGSYAALGYATPLQGRDDE
jgi:hypothetical protein